MESEKQLQNMEEELKLLKGELKQTLSSVRDYLLNMELPTSEFSTILAALGDGGDQTVNMKGTFSLPPDGESSEEANEPRDETEADSSKSEAGTTSEKEGSADSEVAEEKEPHMSAEEEPVTEEEAPEPEEEPEMEETVEETYEEEEPFMPDSELSVDEEQQIEYEKISRELTQSVPKVNLLANLISWVSLARKEIGDEQLPTFLEVYGISGHLSPEMKDVILHLVDITTEKPGDNNMAEVWSNSMLSLHGILTGGDTPLNPIRPHWNEIDEELETDENEVIDIQEEPEEQPVKLKLVFPNGDGKGKEYCIDLTPEVDSNGSDN
jgi:hypothetical protein